MTVPTYDQFIEPLLRFLAEHPEGAPTAVAQKACADALGISDEDRAQRLPSGTQAVYRNRAGWAHDRLKRAGYSHSPKRGYWQLTDAGMKFAAAHAKLSQEQLRELWAVKPGSRLARGEEGEAVIPVEDTESPEERLEAAVAELSESVQTELLEAIMGNSPAFFEQLVLEVLHKMGYGTSRKDIERVGRSNDGGIDGIISLDRLGLEKVYVQAKRWQGNVGREAIQAFYGALAGQRARKGIFITTSGYSKQAVDFASAVEGIILIDGVRLAELMIDFEVGVTPRIVRVPKVDQDFFEE